MLPGLVWTVGGEIPAAIDWAKLTLAPWLRTVISFLQPAQCRLSEMQPLRILILSDGRPGHFNLSEGIAAAVGRAGATRVARLEVRRGRWPGSMVATLATSHLPAEKMLATVYGIDSRQVAETDLIISAGAETLGASIWLARLKGAPNIHYGSIRLFDPQDFALVLTSYARKAHRPRHALALKPSRIDPAALGRPVGSGEPVWPPRVAGLVIGGDAGGIRYSDADWSRILDFVKVMHRDYGTAWRVANSRRTPQAVSDRIAEVSNTADSGIATFLDVRTAGPGTLVPLLCECEVVLCTADSSSMVSECIWMQIPTVAVAPSLFRLPPDEAAYRSWLEGRRWSSTLPIGELNSVALKEHLAGLRPSQANHQELLTRLILDALPELKPGIAGTE